MPDRPARILLVDDEQPIQTLLSFPLQRDGYEVVQASDGREALARFAEQTFDLVVLDVMLPKMDGLEVCRRLRARSSVPIIMLTAKSEEIDKAALETTASDETDFAIVKSPIVGTFFRSAEPGAPSFVDVGSIVKKGQVLCIIEAMKLMNEIDSEYDGEVVKIYVENGQPVQYGERLFAMKARGDV